MLFDLTWSCCGQSRASNNKYPIYFWISTKVVFFVVVACTCSVLLLGTVSLALPGNLICYLSSNCCACDAECMCHVGFVLHILLLIPCLLREIWVMNLPNLTEISHLVCLLVAFVAHTLRQLMLLWQHLSSWNEYCCDTHNALTTPLLPLLARPPCSFEADFHNLPHCIRGAHLVSALAPHNNGVDCIHRDRWWL